MHVFKTTSILKIRLGKNSIKLCQGPNSVFARLKHILKITQISYATVHVIVFYEVGNEVGNSLKWPHFASWKFFEVASFCQAYHSLE